MNSAAAGERLQLEIDYDPVVGDLIATHGRPKYLHVLDRDHIYFFYMEDDRVATIVRDGRPPGTLSEHSPIPGHFFRLLPAAETQRITDARKAYKAAYPKSEGAARVSSVPASPRPTPDSGALSLTGFDLELLIGRFRQPMSAADPGISGWSETVSADGARSGVARAGATEYFIRPDFVSAATSLPRTSRRTSGQVRTSYVRVNRAIFGTRAHAISEGVAPLVDQVVADTTGRTRILRRIAGRTVRIVRDTKRDLIVYGVLSD